MLDYKINGNVIEMTLENGKVVKCSTKWAETSMKSLETDMEDVLLMFLEDNGYLQNEEQEELDTKAKGVNKQVVKSEKPRKKVVRERKPNEDKEYIIGIVAEFLEETCQNVIVENEGKIITFNYHNKQFKFDLTEKRVKKTEK